jgi:hypothetical protein
MKFTKTHNDWNGQFLETISMEIREDAHIDDVLETFTRFMRAVGYVFDGDVQIVNQETDALKDYQDWNFVEEDEVEETNDEMIPAFEGPIRGFHYQYKDNNYQYKDNNTTSWPWPFPSLTKP